MAIFGRSRKKNGKNDRGVNLSSLKIPDPRSVRMDFPNCAEFVGFSKEFVNHLNDFNRSHDNYPCVFILGLVREIYGSDRWLNPNEDLGVWVFPENTSHDITDDNTNPEFERIGRNVRALSAFYDNEYFPHRDDPKVYDKLASIWFEVYFRPYAAEAGIHPRGDKAMPRREKQSVRQDESSEPYNPMHRIPGTDIWRRYGDPVPESICRDSSADEISMI